MHDNTHETDGENRGEPDADSRTYLTFEKQGRTVIIGAVVKGNEVFYANPDAKRCGPVIKGALRTFFRRAWPDIANEAAGGETDGNAGAFQ